MSLQMRHTRSSSAMPEASIQRTLFGTVVTDITAPGLEGSSM
jgi:hypothetical protein